MRFLWSLPALFLCALPAFPGYYYPGTVRDGYTFRNGYWYSGSTPYYSYARTGYYNVPSTYYNGYCYNTYYQQQPYTYYTYEAVPATDYQAPAATPSYSQGWQGKLLEIAAARDKVEGTLRKNALDMQGYMQAVQALGLQGNFHWDHYGAAPAYPATASAPGYQQVPYLANGNTLYGYTYSSVKDLYGDTNLGALYQQSARLTQNAQTLAGQAAGDFSDLVGREGSNRSRVAEILARAQAASAALQAANPQPSQHVESRTFSFRVDTQADGSSQLVPVQVDQQQGGAVPVQQQPQAVPYAQGGADFAALIQNRCASCHSGANASGHFDVAGYATMSLAEKARRVWPRLTHHDPAKRMPLGPKGSPGAALTPEELRAFYTH